MSESVDMPAPPRADKTGDATDGERVARAMNGFVRDFGVLAAAYLETCVHCGLCAEACHFYEVTKDPIYTPIWKVEPFKQAYKREYGPFAPIYRLFNLKHKVTAGELERWQHLLYDSCNVCGRCSLACPMGIDIAELIAEARHGMAAAGLAPHELVAEARDADAIGASIAARLAELAHANAVDIPLDKPGVDIVCLLYRVDLEHYPQSIVATAKIMNHLGAAWSFRSDVSEIDNRSVVSGDRASQRATVHGLLAATAAAGAKVLVLPECGHAYSGLRWHGANTYGKKLPFRVLHISEFLAEEVQSGRLTLRPLAKTVTFHDPCQVSRRGGAIDAPRIVLAALGVELKEMSPTKGMNWCCGGGGGVVAIPRADELRHKVFRLKMAQVEDTGAELPVTSCSGCRRTFDEGQSHYHWDKTMNSLVELVADNLAEAAA